MKLSFAAFAVAALSPASTFAFTSTNVGKNRVAPSSHLFSTVEAPPNKEAPGAGWEPEWENRPGLSREEFLNSDMSKPDRSAMWECPLTRWDSEG